MFFFLINTTFTMKTFSYYFRTCKNLSSLAALTTLPCFNQSIFSPFLWSQKVYERDKIEFFFSTRPGGTILTMVATSKGQEISILLKNERKEDVPQKSRLGYTVHIFRSCIIYSVAQSSFCGATSTNCPHTFQRVWQRGENWSVVWAPLWQIW